MNQEILFHRLIDSEQWRRAIEVGSMLLQIEPERSEIHEAMGCAHLYLDDIEQSIKHLKESLRLNPESDYALYLMSFALIEKKQYKQAKKYLIDAIRIKPNNGSYRGLMSEICYIRNEYEIAKEYITEAIRLDPNNSDFLSLEILIDEQRYDYDKFPAKEKLHKLKNALSLDPENTSVLNHVGLVHLDDLNDPQEAETYFRRALHIDPTVKETRKNVLRSIRGQDILFKLLYFPYDYIVLKIVGSIEWGWRVKWRLLILVPVIQYLIPIGVMTFVFWGIFFYPLIIIYEWMTIIDLRRQSGDLSLKISKWFKPFLKLKRGYRLTFFFLFWSLAWYGLTILFSFNETMTSFSILCAMILIFAFGWGVFSSIFDMASQLIQKYEINKMKRKLGKDL